MRITINGKTYESGKITAAMTRRALQLNVEALDAAAAAEKLRETKDAHDASELLALIGTNLDEKAALVRDVFDGAFTASELLDAVSNAELNGLVQQIAAGK